MRETQIQQGTQEQVTKCINALDFTQDWASWRDTLKEAIAAARGMGISDEEIKDIGVRLGDFLAEKVCAATKEEELMRDMWSVANPEERRVIAQVFFRTLE
jgi:hypothetical protein